MIMKSMDDAKLCFMNVFKPYDKYRALADESMTVPVTRRGRRISCPKRKSILKPPQNQSRVKQETCYTT